MTTAAGQSPARDLWDPEIDQLAEETGALEKLKSRMGGPAAAPGALDDVIARNRAAIEHLHAGRAVATGDVRTISERAEEELAAETNAIKGNVLAGMLGAAAGPAAGPGAPAPAPPPPPSPETPRAAPRTAYPETIPPAGDKVTQTNFSLDRGRPETLAEGPESGPAPWVPAGRKPVPGDTPIGGRTGAEVRICVGGTGEVLQSRVNGVLDGVLKRARGPVRLILGGKTPAGGGGAEGESAALKNRPEGLAGAERAAAAWAAEHAVPYSRYPADWNGAGRGAGAARNEAVVAEGRPHLVLAFAVGGKNAGPRHLAELAADTGAPVEVVGYLGKTYALNDVSTDGYKPPPQRRAAQLVNGREPGGWTRKAGDDAAGGPGGGRAGTEDDDAPPWETGTGNSGGTPEAAAGGRVKVDLAAAFGVGKKADETPRRPSETRAGRKRTPPRSRGKTKAETPGGGGNGAR